MRGKLLFTFFASFLGTLVILQTGLQIFGSFKSERKGSTLGYQGLIAEGCTEPSGGCGSGYYWNSSTCTCQSSCSYPSGGCGDNYYWDSSTCSCKQSSTTSSCSPPSSGCGTNYYWDS